MTLTVRQRDLYVYRLLDVLMAALAWACFFIYRKKIEVRNLNWEQVTSDRNFYLGIIIIPLFWLCLYFIFDKYKDIYRLSRMATIARTILITFMGVLVLFFTILIDDLALNYISYFKAFAVLFLLNLLFTLTARMLWLTRSSRKLKNGEVGYNTIIIGGDKNAIELYEEISGMSKSLGYKFLGFVDSNANSKNLLDKYLPNLGGVAQLNNIIVDNQIEEVIVAIETSEHSQLKKILNKLFEFGDDVLVKIIPDMYDIMLGTVKMNHVFGAVLIEIKQEILPAWQKLIKRMMDVSLSVVLLIILSPLILFAAIRTSVSGPIIFRQERIGFDGKPFKILKFRSMHINAESNGPQLSHESDDRITTWGATMRKYRIDEIPQLWNVLKGQMSLVGPRPERKFYIDQITAVEPQYRHLLKVRPGITSWGQVKYGYASNLQQMLQRLKYDLLYIENMSIALDIKILFYTILVLLQGRGK